MPTPQPDSSTLLAASATRQAARRRIRRANQLRHARAVLEAAVARAEALAAEILLEDERDPELER